MLVLVFRNGRASLLCPATRLYLVFRPRTLLTFIARIPMEWWSLCRYSRVPFLAAFFDRVQLILLRLELLALLVQLVRHAPRRSQ